MMLYERTVPIGVPAGCTGQGPENRIIRQSGSISPATEEHGSARTTPAPTNGSILSQKPETLKFE